MVQEIRRACGKAVLKDAITEVYVFPWVSIAKSHHTLPSLKPHLPSFHPTDPTDDPCPALRYQHFPISPPLPFSDSSEPRCENEPLTPFLFRGYSPMGPGCGVRLEVLTDRGARTCARPSGPMVQRICRGAYFTVIPRGQDVFLSFGPWVTHTAAVNELTYIFTP